MPILGAMVVGVIVPIFVSSSSVLHQVVPLSPTPVQAAAPPNPTNTPPTIQTVNRYLFVTKWGSHGTVADGQFVSAQGIAVDFSGNVYVADSDNNRIQKFSSR